MNPYLAHYNPYLAAINGYGPYSPYASSYITPYATSYISPPLVSYNPYLFPASSYLPGYLSTPYGYFYR